MSDILPCPFCEGEAAPLDENDHTSCTNIACGYTAYMHVDAWNNRPAMSAYARIEELEAELGGWLPIETAPRDGTVVDLWHKGGFRITEEFWVEEDGDGFWSGLFLNEDFTHWMPLPSPPEKIESGANAAANSPALAKSSHEEAAQGAEND